MPRTLCRICAFVEPPLSRFGRTNSAAFADLDDKGTLAHFAIDNAAIVDVEVKLPSDKFKKLAGVKANQPLRIQQ